MRIKKRPDIKNLLGLTQEEMAQVLGITKSQWSMYKSGLREIPLNSLKRFGNLLAIVKDENRSDEIIDLVENERLKAKANLKEEYEKMIIKFHRLKKEIISLEKQRGNCFAAIKTAEFLGKQEELLELAIVIRERALKILKKHSLSKLQQMQLQKENIEFFISRIQQSIEKQEE